MEIKLNPADKLIANFIAEVTAFNSNYKSPLEDLFRELLGC